MFLSELLELHLCSEKFRIIIFKINESQDVYAQDQLPYFRGHARQRGRGFGALAQTIGRTAIPFIRRCDLISAGDPYIGDLLTGIKKVKAFFKDVGIKTLRKQIGAGKKKRRISTKNTSKSSRRRRRTRKDIFHKLK